eukprot:GHRR01012665.1.p1 GENE.GHRR01012665.1~~GHRR01012665.1.p1  ORF type:complete len:102 (-),score=17.59 GHRR01012665.1:934-1239(-)
MPWLHRATEVKFYACYMLILVSTIKQLGLRPGRTLPTCGDVLRSTSSGSDRACSKSSPCFMPSVDGETAAGPVRSTAQTVTGMLDNQQAHYCCIDYDAAMA